MTTVNHYVIEVGECGLVHTLHEPIEGPVITGDRGSKKYVCGQGENPFPWPTAPFDTKTFTDEPELFVEMSPPVGVVMQQAQSQQQSQWQTASSFSNVSAGASNTFLDFDHITIHCGCEQPPVDPPIVPLPPGGVLLASALILTLICRR